MSAWCRSEENFNGMRKNQNVKLGFNAETNAVYTDKAAAQEGETEKSLGWFPSALTATGFKPALVDKVFHIAVYPYFITNFGFSASVS